ncbi:hypothetical protein HKCCE3408_17840 [Rhodobacterales bacterium HKCCE3408]|nr:hypothetical protein [Rhodobacterales bacterium HKCCE3408]
MTIQSLCAATLVATLLALPAAADRRGSSGNDDGDVSDRVLAQQSGGFAGVQFAPRPSNRVDASSIGGLHRPDAAVLEQEGYSIPWMVNICGDGNWFVFWQNDAEGHWIPGSFDFGCID